jgi:fucose permease
MRPETTNKNTRLGHILMSFLGLMMIAVATTMMGPAFPSMKQELAVPLEMLGSLASAWNIGYLLMPIGGIASDRYGEPTVLAISFLALGTAVGLVFVAFGYPMLLGLFLIAGVGCSFGEVSMNSLMSKLYPKRSGFALSILHSFFSAGAFIGPILAGILIVQYGNWRLPYLLASLLIAPLALSAFLVARRAKSQYPTEMTETSESEDSSIRILDVLAEGRVLLVAGFFYFGAELGANAWLPSFLMIERSFPIELASLSIGLFWASMALGRLGLASFADRVGYRKMIVASASFGAIFILGAISIQGKYVIMVLWCLSGFAFGPIMPTIFAWTASLFPSRRGAATGAVYSVGFIGAVFSPWVLGALADLYSLDMAALYLAFSAFAIAPSALMLRRRAVRSPND